MTYHRLTRSHDSFGIVPTVFALDKHGKRDRKRFVMSADQLPTQTGPIRFEQTTLQEGPLRHPDFVEWSGDGSPFGYFFVVSPRVHALLQLAALPAHRVFDATVQWPKSAPKKHGRGTTPYFLYAFDQAGLLDALDLTSTSLSCTVRLLSERLNTRTDLAPGLVANGADAWARAKDLCPADQRPWVLPTALLGPLDAEFNVQLDFESPHFPLAVTDVDLLFLDHSFDPWVSDGLRDALIELQATGLAFSEAWDASRLQAPTTDARSSRAGAMKDYAVANAGPPATDPVFARELERRNEVLSRRDRVREKRGAAAGATPIQLVEERLDVELPWQYLEALQENTLPDEGRWQFLALSDLRTLEDIDEDWTARSAPFAVRALIVAVDDGGDFLGYVLREDSMTKLDNKLMHFQHETATVTPSRFRLTPKESSRKG